MFGMRKFFFNVSYIGTGLRGVSKDALEISNSIDTTSVTGLLELALAKIFPSQPSVYISSRTDAGVHAISNSGHILVTGDERPTISGSVLCYQVNKFFIDINSSIKIENVIPVSEDFHARFCAKSRTYLYRFATIKPEFHQAPVGTSKRGKQFYPRTPIIEKDRCYFVNRPKFDLEAVQSATKLLTGTHDFGSFMSANIDVQKVDRSTVRTLKKLEVRSGRSFINSDFDPAVNNWCFWELYCHGQSFLYKQVRWMLSVLLGVGQGHVEQSYIQQRLENPSTNNWVGHVPLAPPHGLYLLNVEYNPSDLLLKENAGMSLLEERRKKLRATETRVTQSDGRVFVECSNDDGERVAVESSQPRSAGFVVDTKPDLQVGCILPNLLLSSQDVAADKNLLVLHKVTHVLSIGVPDITIPVSGIVHHHLDLLDLPESTLMDKLLKACEFINEGISQEVGCVLVHCNAGVSRAPTIVIGYLIKSQGMSPEEALHLVRGKRPSVKPNEGFWRQIVDYYNTLKICTS